MSSGPTPLCVECRRRPVDPLFRPFCSQRCRILDLARWADGSYQVPGESIEPDAPADPDDTPPRC